MSILVISPRKELQIETNSFQTNRTKIVFENKKIVIVGFRIKNTPIIVDQISRDKLLQPNKRYTLIGNCVRQGKNETWRLCGVFRIPKNLPLQQVKKYIRNIIKVAVYYPRNTYYLRDKDIAQLGLIQTIMEYDPETKEIELSVGETALRLCLGKNAEIKLDINDEENREQVSKLIRDLAYLDCKHSQKFFHNLSKEIIEQIRKNYARKVTNFFEQHLEQINWEYLSSNPNIPAKFFERHLERVDWTLLSENPNIPAEFFERHLENIDWYWLSNNPNIPAEFFERHLENVKWQTLSGNPNIPVEFFERHLENVKWGMLSENPNIPVEFFERHLENVRWHWLSYNPNIPVEFFERHLDRIDWSGLSYNSNIPVEFFERHLDRIDWRMLSENNNIPEEFFERHLEHVEWDSLSSNPNIPAEFFERHLENVDWEILSHNSNIQAEFFERHLEHVEWDSLSSNPNIPAEFFERHLEHVNWDALAINPNIPLEFFIEHLDINNYGLLSGNRFLYNNYALMNAVKESDLFPEFSSLWKREAIKIIRDILNKIKLGK